MPKNRIALIQVWFGKLPSYFEYHHSTCLNQRIDFYFFTDQEVDKKFEAENIKFIKITTKDLQQKLFDKTKKQLVVPSAYKLNDIKPAYVDLFQDHVKDYEFVGWYDIDTLLGDVVSWMEPYLSEFDVISFGEDGPIYNRISGPLTITRNTEKVRTVYLSDPVFYECMSKPEYDEYDERKVTETYRRLGIPVKILFECSNMEPISYKIRFDAIWTGGKVYVGGKEKLIYHFFMKKLTAFDRKGNTVIARRKVEYLDDFYYITYFTENYEPMVRTLINSLEKFSRRKCILYTVNYSSKLVHELSEQFIIRRIDITGRDFLDSRGRSFNTITSKPVIQLDSLKSFPGKKFVFLDTDIYVTVVIDSIAKYFDDLENYPLTNSHVHDVIYSIEENGDHVSSLHALGDEISVPITVFPRRKTNVMLYDERSAWFFKEQMQIYNDHKDSKRRAIFKFHDEDTFNVILSKYNFHGALPVVDIEEVFDLNLEVYNHYTYSDYPISERAVVPVNDRGVYVFHGYKNVELFQRVEDTYGSTVLDKTDLIVEYDGKDVALIKTSFFRDKRIRPNVNVALKDGNAELFKCGWEIFNSQFFFIWGIHLNNHTTYLVELTEQETDRLIFRTELITNY